MVQRSSGHGPAFVLFCRDQGLFTARLVALDGSKFRAAAAPSASWAGARSPRRQPVLTGGSPIILAGLDMPREPDEAPSATAAALQALRSRRAQLDRLAAQLDSEERNTLVEGEPDARPMGIGASRKPPSYNMQTAVDAETGLIVHHEVTTEPTDNRLLHPMAKATKDAVKAPTLTVVADAGYSNGADAAACERRIPRACRRTVRSTTRVTARCSIDLPLCTSRITTLIRARQGACWCASR